MNKQPVAAMLLTLVLQAASAVFVADNAVAQVCPGDINGDQRVTVDEILTVVNVALQGCPVSNGALAQACPGDINDDDQVTVDEILTMVNWALQGCYVALTPTAAATTTPTASPLVTPTLPPPPPTSSTTATLLPTATRPSTPTRTVTPALTPTRTPPAAPACANGTQVGLTFTASQRQYVDTGLWWFTGNTMSVAAWVYVPTTGHYFIAGQSGGINRTAWELSVSANGYAFTVNDNAFGVHTASSGLPLMAGQWHHVAGTLDGSTLQVYIDGVADGSAVTWPAGALIYRSTTDVTLGWAPGDPAWLTGTLDDVRVYAIGLSASQVAAIFSGGSGQCDDTAGGLLAHWKLDDGSGATAADASGNGHTGTLFGTTLPAWSAGFVCCPNPPTPTPTITATPTRTRTPTVTSTPTRTATVTPTLTPTSVPTNTPTPTRTPTATTTPTSAPSPTPSPTPTAPASATPTPTRTPTATPPPTSTFPPTPAPTSTATPTGNPTPTRTLTPTRTPTRTPTPTRTRRGG